MQLAHILGTGKHGEKPDPKRALRLLEYGCDGRHSKSCMQAATVYQSCKRPHKALEFYKKGCDLSNMVACHNEGMFRLFGVGCDKNEERGMLLLKKACQGGIRSACQTYQKRQKEQSNHETTSQESNTNAHKKVSKDYE